MLEDRFHRVHRRLAETADRGVAHHFGQLAEQILVPARPFHDLDRLLGSNAARRALTAALVLEEAQEVERDLPHAVLVGEDDDGMRADEAAMRLERAEIERNVGHAGRQDAARGAARQIALEDVANSDAAAELVDQLARRDAGRRQLDAGRSYSAGDREAAHALTVVTALRGNERGALLDDVAHPEDGLDVVDQGRPAEEADLTRKRRLVARQTALALDALEHRRFLAADIGAGAAPEMDLDAGRDAGARELGDLGGEDRAALRVFVAQIDVDFRRLDRPGADQHALKEAMRVGLEVMAVLEGAGLALIGVDRHQARALLLAHEAPFAPGGKAGAAEPAQLRILERLENALDIPLAREAVLEQTVAAAGAIGGEADIVRHMRVGRAIRHRLGDAAQRRLLVQGVADRCNRRVVATAHAGRTDNPHARSQTLRQLGEEGLRAEERTGQAVADAHGDGRRRRLPIHHDVKMGVERGDLVDLDESQFHLVSQRRQVAGMQAAVPVLNEVQMLNQEIALTRAGAEQLRHLGESGRIDLPPLREIPALAPPGAGMNRPLWIRHRCCRHGCHHLPFIARSMVLPSAAGEFATVIPARFIAAILSPAVPSPPEMIAPACPMRRPGGAVIPAMKPTTGFLILWVRRNSAASSSAEPPISPIMTMPLVCSSARYISRQSMKLVPLTGSPPMPMQVDWPSPAAVVCATAS